MSKQIQEILKKWKKEAKASGVVQFKYKRNYVGKGTLFIYTSQPGYFVGRAGILAEKYEKILKDKIGNSFLGVSFVETDYYWA